VNFSLIGAAGYIAPKHMKAIRDTSNVLVAAMDKHDSVGIIDSYFPEAMFFQEIEKLGLYLDSLKRNDQAVDYISVASPNFLHSEHIQFGLNAGANVICEKPIVLDLSDLDYLEKLENESDNRIYSVLQLRHHPAILALKEKVSKNKVAKADIELTYITSRGKWYLQSWKGDIRKSGGVATNVGVHFFDMLHFVFGELQENFIYLNTPTKSSGYIEYEGARVRWFLSLDVEDIPKSERAQGKRTYRSLTSDGETLEFSDGFINLHTDVYREILSGRGCGLKESRTAIKTVAYIRNAPLDKRGNLTHPMAASIKKGSI
tara:strand:- start:12189 stop:13139 length:951 start_codon:yes stop_codon:yes gene_type:complete